MKKYEWLRGGMRQRISTGCKAFDNQVVCVSKGNSVGGCFLGLYVAAVAETKRNGMEFDPGYLTKYDMAPFLDFAADSDSCTANRFRDVATQLASDGKIIVYCPYHYTDSGRRIVHGFIFADEENRLLSVINARHGKYHYQSFSVLVACVKYLCDDGSILPSCRHDPQFVITQNHKYVDETESTTFCNNCGKVLKEETIKDA